MTTKMKGLLKSLRYISQIFDEEKEQEMQIGFPTDVKHVAHIGWDGPTHNVDSSPSWMKEFNSSTGFQSAPLGPPGDSRSNDSQIKWVSEDSKRASRRATTNSPAKDLSELPKSSIRYSDNTSNDSLKSKKDPSSKSSRQSRRHQSKVDPSQEVASSSSPRGVLPDIPKKSRRKKSKESVGGGGGGSTRRSRLKGVASSDNTNVHVYSDPGPNTGFTLGKPGSMLGPIPIVDDGDGEKKVVSKE